MIETAGLDKAPRVHWVGKDVEPPQQIVQRLKRPTPHHHLCPALVIPGRLEVGVLRRVQQGVCHLRGEHQHGQGAAQASCMGPGLGVRWRTCPFLLSCWSAWVCCSWYALSTTATTTTTTTTACCCCCCSRADGCWWRHLLLPARAQLLALEIAVGGCSNNGTVGWIWEGIRRASQAFLDRLCIRRVVMRQITKDAGIRDECCIQFEGNKNSTLNQLPSSQLHA